MKKTTATFLLLSAVMSGAALAQDASTGIRESTDPAKADSVLRHAEELRMKQDQMMSSGASAAGSPDQKTERATTKATKKKGKSSAKKKKRASSERSLDGTDQDSMDK